LKNRRESFENEGSSQGFRICEKKLRANESEDLEKEKGTIKEKGTEGLEEKREEITPANHSLSGGRRSDIEAKISPGEES